MQITLKKCMQLIIYSLCISAIIGCQSLNSRFGCDVADHSKAKEFGKLKFPANAVQPSKRYDIPPIANNNDSVLSDMAPPDY